MTGTLASFSPLPASPPGELHHAVDGLTERYVSVWNAASPVIPTDSRVFSPAEQERHAHTAEEILRRAAGTGPSRSEAPRRIIELIAAMDEGLAPERATCRSMLQTMADAGTQFADKARKFDGSLPTEGLAQALRNLWVMNSIQILCELPVRLTPSCFAYSLLYPYTDNLLDDPTLSDTDKRSFTDRLGTRLAGLPCAVPASWQEERIWQLLLMIERQWPRDRYPLVYDSLLAIHRAQAGSLLLHRKAASVASADVVRLTVCKGGTSVLAHGFLLLGALPGIACRWIFGFGSLLQLIDDLQDLSEDRSHGHATVFTECDPAVALAVQVNRLLSYGHRMIAEFPAVKTREQAVMMRLIRGSSLVLVCEAVASMPQSFPPAYAAVLERHSPLSFSCLRSLHERGRDLLTSKSLDMFEKASGRTALRRHLARAS